MTREVDWKGIAERLGRAAMEVRDNPGFPEFYLRELNEALEVARQNGADIPSDPEGTDWEELYFRRVSPESTIEWANKAVRK